MQNYNRKDDNIKKNQKQVLYAVGIWIAVFSILTLLMTKKGFTEELTTGEIFTVASIPSVHSYRENSSYLNNLSPDVMAEFDSSRRGLNRKIIPEKEARKMRQRYDDLNREYQMRASYGLVGFDRHKQHADQMEDFSRYLLRFVLSYQMTEGLNKAEKNSESVRTFRQVQEGVKSVVQGSTKVSLSDSFRFGTRTNIPQRSGKIWMKSDVVNGSFAMDFDTNRFINNGLQPVNYRYERYKLSFDRTLPVWSLRSGVTYGATTTRVSATISKQLTNHLSAEVGAVRGIDAGKSGLPTGAEGVMTFNYGINF